MKTKILIGIAILIIASVVILLISHYLNKLGGGYRHVGERSDDLRIVKDNKIIVGATIIDYKVISGFVVGLRLPAEYLECDNGGGYKIVIKNNKEYFILSTDSDEVWLYRAKEDFEVKLQELGIKKGTSLDYSKFEEVWDQYANYYKNIDYSSCEILSERP